MTVSAAVLRYANVQFVNVPQPGLPAKVLRRDDLYSAESGPIVAAYGTGGAPREAGVKTPIVIAAVVVLATVSGADAAQKSRHRRQAAEPPQQIACTVIGCVPVPRGCGQTPGKTRGGSPTGGDIIVCPPGVAPFK